MAKKKSARRQGVPSPMRRPRIPALAALSSQPGPKGAGPHGKSRRAERRADKVALAKASRTGVDE